jgi:O-antigen/teichoic acid export membrane protein
MIGIIFGRLSIWLCRIAAARILGASVLGEFGFIESTVNMFMSYAGLGMSIAVSKNLAECFRTDTQRAGRIIGTVSLLSGSAFVLLLIGFLFCSKSLALDFSDNARFVASLRIGTLLALMVPSGIAAAMLNSFQAFPHVAISNMIQGLASLLLLLALAPLWGLNGVILAFGSGMLLTLVYQVVIIRGLCRKYQVHIKFGKMRQEFPLLWRYGIPTMLSGILAGPVEWGTRAILVKYGGGMQELGLYVGVLSLCSLFIAASALLQNVSIPVLSASLNFEEKEKGIYRNIFLYWSVSIFSVIFLVSFSDRLVNFLLGPEFSNAGLLLAIVAIAIGLRVFFTSFGIALIVLDRVWQMSFNSMVDAPIFLLGAIFLTPRWGAKGLALSYLISSIIVLLLLYRSTVREMAWASPSKAGIVLTIMVIISSLLINSIDILWLSISATFLLLCVTSTVLYFLARKFDLLGEFGSKITLLLKPR